MITLILFIIKTISIAQLFFHSQYFGIRELSSSYHVMRCLYKKIFYPGEKENSKVRRLRDPSRRVFCSSGSDTFIMSTQNILGDISSLTVYHDNSGGGWFLR